MQIQAVLNGEEIEITAVEGQSVLETLLNAGWNAPYSCMEGSCMACLAKVLQGKVFQDDPGILTDENVSGCETLTCQAKPLSKIVRIDYDNL
jgi:ferredoxin